MFFLEIFRVKSLFPKYQLTQIYIYMIPEGEAAHRKQSNAIYENRVYIYIIYI